MQRTVRARGGLTDGDEILEDPEAGEGQGRGCDVPQGRPCSCPARKARLEGSPPGGRSEGSRAEALVGSRVRERPARDAGEATGAGLIAGALVAPDQQERPRV